MSRAVGDKSVVLVLTDSFPPCPYAASQRIGSFAEVLSSSGLKVVVLTLFRCLSKFPINERAVDESFPIYNFRYPSDLLRVSVVMVNPLLVLLLLFGATAAALMRRFKAVVVSVPQGEVAIAGFLVSKLLSIPLVVDLRDWYPVPSVELSSHRIPRPRILNEILIRLFDAIYIRSSRLVCVDANIHRRLLASGVSPDKVSVIPNGADTATYKPCSLEERAKIRSNHGISKDKIIFVYAGSLAKHYPVIDVIEGAKDLSGKSNDFEFLIISFSEYHSYASYVRRLGLEGVVKFLGPLPVAETAQVISACDVGVVTYGKEKIWQKTYGSKIFAYMACGLPILASGPSGSVIDELINEHRLGSFVGNPNEKNFAKGFAFFVNNRDTLKVMGENAEDVVASLYDRRVLGLKLVELLEADRN